MLLFTTVLLIKVIRYSAIAHKVNKDEVNQFVYPKYSDKWNLSQMATPAGHYWRVAVIYNS